MSINIVLVISLFINFGVCEKVFKSIPVVFKIYENESVLLPCYIQDNGEFNGCYIYYLKNIQLSRQTQKMHYLKMIFVL